MNREYAIALQWVRERYPDLYRHAEYILLVPGERFPSCQRGQCSSDNFISIADMKLPVGEFVDTLVHELTHAKQNRTDCTMSNLGREEEAYQAGIEAGNRYIIEAAPWLPQKEKRK